MDELAAKYHLPREKIAMQFSDEQRLGELRKAAVRKRANAKLHISGETDYDKLINVQPHLAQNARVRPDIQIFVTTSKNKEGINICDEDIRHVYVESHSLSDIRQMAGRLRHGVEHAYVIKDSPGHHQVESSMEQPAAKLLLNLPRDNYGETGQPQTIHVLDEMLRAVCNQRGINNLCSNPQATIRAFNTQHPEIGSFIDLMREKFPYIQYSFFTNEFRHYALRELGMDFATLERQLFSDAMANDQKLMDLFGNAFPGTTLHLPVSKEHQAKQYLLQVMTAHPENQYSESEIDQLIQTLDDMMTAPGQQNRRKSAKAQPNRVLHRLDMEVQRVSRKSKTGPQYHLWELIPWNPQKSKQAS